MRATTIRILRPSLRRPSGCVPDRKRDSGTRWRWSSRIWSRAESARDRRQHSPIVERALRRSLLPPPSPVGSATSASVSPVSAATSPTSKTAAWPAAGRPKSRVQAWSPGPHPDRACEVPAVVRDPSHVDAASVFGPRALLQEGPGLLLPRGQAPSAQAVLGRYRLEHPGPFGRLLLDLQPVAMAFGEPEPDRGFRGEGLPVEVIRRALHLPVVRRSVGANVQLLRAAPLFAWPAMAPPNIAPKLKPRNASARHC